MFFILDLIYTTVNELVTNGNTELNVILGHITNIINVESLRLLYSLPNLGPVIQNGCYMPPLRRSARGGLLINNGYMNASDFAIYPSCCAPAEGGGFLNNNGGIIPSDFITSIEQAISALFLLLADRRRDLNIDPNNLQLDARVLEESGYQDTLIN